jgi:hypothetical protein
MGVRLVGIGVSLVGIGAGNEDILVANDGIASDTTGERRFQAAIAGGAGAAGKIVRETSVSRDLIR